MTLTLRRDVDARDWDEKGPYTVTTLPAGTALNIPFCPGATPVQEEPYAEVDHEAVLLASAEDPCMFFLTQSAEGELRGEMQFACGFDQDADVCQCRGDRCRCPVNINKELKEPEGLPEEFDMLFAVDADGTAWALEMPDGWKDFMINGTNLDDNGFAGHEKLAPGVYRAHAKLWFSKDWETGICDDAGANLSNIELIWSPAKPALPEERQITVEDVGGLLQDEQILRGRMSADGLHLYTSGGQHVCITAGADGEVRCYLLADSDDDDPELEGQP